MQTFSELFNTLKTDSTNTGVKTDTSFETIVNKYNNVWGVISDTRMWKDCDGSYKITGRFVGTEQFGQFIYANTWRGTDFKHSSGYVNLDEFIHSLGYTITTDYSPVLGNHAVIEPLSSTLPNKLDKKL